MDFLTRIESMKMTRRTTFDVEKIRNARKLKVIRYKAVPQTLILKTRLDFEKIDTFKRFLRLMFLACCFCFLTLNVDHYIDVLILDSFIFLVLCMKKNYVRFIRKARSTDQPKKGRNFYSTGCVDRGCRKQTVQ